MQEILRIGVVRMPAHRVHLALLVMDLFLKLGPVVRDKLQIDSDLRELLLKELALLGGRPSGAAQVDPELRDLSVVQQALGGQLFPGLLELSPRPVEVEPVVRSGSGFLPAFEAAGDHIHRPLASAVVQHLEFAFDVKARAQRLAQRLAGADDRVLHVEDDPVHCRGPVFHQTDALPAPPILQLFVRAYDRLEYAPGYPGCVALTREKQLPGGETLRHEIVVQHVDERDLLAGVVQQAGLPVARFALIGIEIVSKIRVALENDLRLAFENLEHVGPGAHNLFRLAKLRCPRLHGDRSPAALPVLFGAQPIVHGFAGDRGGYVHAQNVDELRVGLGERDSESQVVHGRKPGHVSIVSREVSDLVSLRLLPVFLQASDARGKGPGQAGIDVVIRNSLEGQHEIPGRHGARFWAAAVIEAEAGIAMIHHAGFEFHLVRQSVRGYPGHLVREERNEFDGTLEEVICAEALIHVALETGRRGITAGGRIQ